MSWYLWAGERQNFIFGKCHLMKQKHLFSQYLQIWLWNYMTRLVLSNYSHCKHYWALNWNHCRRTCRSKKSQRVRPWNTLCPVCHQGHIYRRVAHGHSPAALPQISLALLSVLICGPVSSCKHFPILHNLRLYIQLVVFSMSQFCNNYHNLILTPWKLRPCVGLCGLNQSQDTKRLYWVGSWGLNCGQDTKCLYWAIAFLWPHLSSFHPSQILLPQVSIASLLVLENGTERLWRKVT